MITGHKKLFIIVIASKSVTEIDKEFPFATYPSPLRA